MASPSMSERNSVIFVILHPLSILEKAKIPKKLVRGGGGKFLMCFPVLKGSARVCKRLLSSVAPLLRKPSVEQKQLEKNNSYCTSLKLLF